MPASERSRAQAPAGSQALRLCVQAFDQLNQQRWILGMFKISCVEREAGNQEPPRLERTRNALPHQKSPRVMTVAKNESEYVREVCELLEMDLRDIMGDRYTIMDIQAPEPPIEARYAAGIMEHDKVRQNISGVFQREHGPRRGSGSDADCLASGQGAEFIQTLDLGARPRLRMHREQNSV